MSEWKAIVDLTSLDLRTGAVQLPGRLADLPPAGALPAVDAADGTSYLLQLEAPRELRGLKPYFELHALRTNDAINLTFESGQLTIDAIRRQRRNAGSSPSARHAISPISLVPEQAGEETPPLMDDLPDSEPPAVETRPTPEPEVFQHENVGLETAFSQPAEPADPFAGFAAAGTLESFEEDLDISSLGSEPDELPEQFKALEPDGTPAVAGPTAVPASPVIQDPDAETPEPGTMAQSIPDSVQLPETVPAALAVEAATAGYYTLPQRRPFRAHMAQSLPQGLVLPPVVERALDRLATAAEPMDKQPAETTPALAPEVLAEAASASTGQEAVSVTESLEAYLARPDLPALIRVSLLAAELQVDEVELAEAVTAHTRQPDNRLTYVRPDYYLFKRPRD